MLWHLTVVVVLLLLLLVLSGYWYQMANKRLHDLPPRCSCEPIVVRHRDGRPLEDLVVHCFCVCIGIALLGDLLGSKQVCGTLISICLLLS